MSVRLRFYSKFNILLFLRVTREHREKLAKAVNGLFTKHKQEVKSIENKYMKKLEIRDEKISAEQYRIIQVQVSR